MFSPFNELFSWRYQYVIILLSYVLKMICYDVLLIFYIVLLILLYFPVRYWKTRELALPFLFERKRTKEKKHKGLVFELYTD